MGDRRLTLQQAADQLGVHYMTAYRYVRTGRLPAVRQGGAWRINPTDLDRVRPLPTRGRPTSNQANARARPAGGFEARLVAGDEGRRRR